MKHTAILSVILSAILSGQVASGEDTTKAREVYSKEIAKDLEVVITFGPAVPIADLKGGDEVSQSGTTNGQKVEMLRPVYVFNVDIDVRRRGKFLIRLHSFICPSYLGCDRDLAKVLDCSPLPSGVVVLFMTPDTRLAVFRLRSDGTPVASGGIDNMQFPNLVAAAFRPNLPGDFSAKATHNPTLDCIEIELIEPTPEEVSPFREERRHVLLREKKPLREMGRWDLEFEMVRRWSVWSERKK